MWLRSKVSDQDALGEMGEDSAFLATDHALAIFALWGVSNQYRIIASQISAESKGISDPGHKGVEFTDLIRDAMRQTSRIR